MSDFSLDLNTVFGSQQAQKTAENSTNKKAGNDLVMDDFLKLMVAQFQNQSIDSTADTTEMMNQMVQMSVIQAITNLSTLVTDSTNLSYAASLVGKEVTIGEQNGSTIEQILGTVTGTGTLDGKQVLFLDHKDTPYDIANILAVGSIPDSIPKSEMDNAAAWQQSSAWTTTAETETGSGTDSGDRDPHVPDENGALG
ncbi:MAG: flagellar hook capping protein [Oscillospiraceae bacterium]|nr:flagellar hook capping protein [Oscillospiraceae bacterium]